MNNKILNRIWVLFLLIMHSYTMCAYEEITIGESATDVRTPINFQYINTFQGCQMIYTENELSDIGNEAIIDQIGFYYENTSSIKSQSCKFEVKISSTNSNNFYNYNSTLSLGSDVYSNTVTIGGWTGNTSGWVWIPVSYIYKGGNILVEIRNTEKASSTSSNVYFQATTAADYRTLSWTGASSSTATSINGSRTKARPNTCFRYSNYNSWTEETFTTINCNTPGQLYSLYKDANSPYRLKITGKINDYDLCSLFNDYYQNIISYLDLSDATIFAGGWEGHNNNRFGERPTTDNVVNLKQGLSPDNIRKIVLPNNCISYTGYSCEIYTKSASAFDLNTSYQCEHFFCPEGSKSAWRSYFDSHNQNTVIVVDSPIKHINKDEYFSLSTAEISSIDVIELDCKIDAYKISQLNKMPQLEEIILKSYCQIECYHGTIDSYENGYTSYEAKTIPNNAFKGNTSLRRFVTYHRISIGDHSFQNCTNLKSFECGEGVSYGGKNEVGDYAFDGCKSLKTFSIKNLTSVGDFAFRNTGLSTISLSSCTYYDDDTYYVSYYQPITRFGKCPLFGSTGFYSYTRYWSGHDHWEKECIQDIECIDNDYTDTELCKNGELYGLSATTSWLSLNYEVYRDWSICDLPYIKSINLGEKATSIGEAFLKKCPKLETITSTSSMFMAEDGVLYNADKTELIKFPSAKRTETFTIPRSVKKIREWALEDLKNIKEIICPIIVPLEISEEVFEDCDLSLMTLYVPSTSIDLYKNSKVWSKFGKIVPTPAQFVEKTSENSVENILYVENCGSLSLSNDVYSISLDQDVENCILSYTRTYPDNRNWQALYVPFSMTYDDWKDDYEIARLNDIHQYDDNGDGIIDRTELESIKLKEGGAIKANTPYLIKAKTAGKKTLNLYNNNIYVTTENSFDVTSWETRFIFTGTYHTITDMATQGHYALANGALMQATSDKATLGCFRWYLDITDREGNPTQLSAKCIRLSFDDGEATDINIINAETDNSNEMYSISGVRMNKSKMSNGLYISNGKKIIIK